MAVTPRTLVKPGGQQITRRERIFITTLKKEVNCTPYDDHFIYANSTIGESSLMCTCGSVAVVANVKAGDYKNQGLLIVCLVHATFGRHTTGDGRRWI